MQRCRQLLRSTDSSQRLTGLRRWYHRPATGFEGVAGVTLVGFRTLSWLCHQLRRVTDMRHGLRFFIKTGHAAATHTLILGAEEAFSKIGF